MSKTYHFSFVAQKAEFSAGMVSVIYGANCTLAAETRVATLADALVYLEEFSAKSPAPHYATLSMVNRTDRKPAGYDKQRKFLHREIDEKLTSTV